MVPSVTADRPPATSLLASWLMVLSVLLAQPCLAANQDSAQSVQAIEDKLATGKSPSQADFEQLEQILGQEPKNFQAHLALGMCLDSMRLPGQAVEQYDAAVKLAPDDPKAVTGLIRALSGARQTKTVPGLLAMAVKRFPNDPDVLFLAGVDALQTNQTPRAYYYLQNAYSLSMQDGRDVPGLKACYAETLLYVGGMKIKHKGEGDRRRGNEYIKFAAKLAKQELDQEKARYYQHFQPKTQEQIKKLEEAIAGDPKVVKANMVLGIADTLMYPPRYAQSVDHLLIAADAMPTRTDLNFEAAKQAVWAARYRVAIIPALHCVVLTTNKFSSDANVMKLLVESFKHLPRETAVAELSPILKNPESFTGFVHNELGEAMEQAGWQADALTQFEIAARLEPEFGTATFNLARSHELYLHDYDGALVLYQKAQQLGLPPELSVQDRIFRLEERLALGQKQDIAWHLKDILFGRNPGAR